MGGIILKKVDNKPPIPQLYLICGINVLIKKPIADVLNSKSKSIKIIIGLNNLKINESNT